VNHVAGELFKMMAGVNMVHVPYRGTGPALTDLLGGQVQVMFGTMPASIEQIRAGRLRAIAVTGATRWEGLPDTPTVGEFIPSFEVTLWNGLGAPRNTPTEIINKLNMEINSALADSKMRASFADLGSTPLPVSPADFGKFIVEEAEKWGKVIKSQASSRSDLALLNFSVRRSQLAHVAYGSITSFANVTSTSALPPLATKQRTSICDAKGQKATYAPQHNECLIRSPRRRAAASKQPQECDTLSRLDYDAIFCPALGRQPGH